MNIWLQNRIKSTDDNFDVKITTNKQKIIYADSFVLSKVSDFFERAFKNKQIEDGFYSIDLSQFDYSHVSTIIKGIYDHTFVPSECNINDLISILTIIDFLQMQHDGSLINHCISQFKKSLTLGNWESACNKLIECDIYISLKDVIENFLKDRVSHLGKAVRDLLDSDMHIDIKHSLLEAVSCRIKDIQQPNNSSSVKPNKDLQGRTLSKMDVVIFAGSCGCALLAISLLCSNFSFRTPQLSTLINQTGN